MKFKYELCESLVRQISKMDEFACGATQVTVKTKNGREYPGLLISTCKYPVALRGYNDLPFSLEDIEFVYQSNEDKSPKVRGGWKYWDGWE